MSLVSSDEIPTESPTPREQHPLLLSVLLHLMPGAALTVFIVLGAPVVEALGFPAMFALFLGIGLVLTPIELGYLLLHAKRTTGMFSLRETVDYREHIPGRQLALWTLGLFAWFIVFLVLSTAFLDEWLVDNVFGWIPDEILEFSRFEDGESIGTGHAIVMVVVMYALNGFIGPVVEELYFRGHLLPRIDRYGSAAPILNAILFSLYHFWTPWQNPARIIGFLPISWLVWRRRSLQIGLAAHVTINVVFLTLLIVALLAAA